RAASTVLAVEARIAEMREEERVAVGSARAAPVLVDARPHVECARSDVGAAAGPVERRLDHDAASPLVGAVLDPAEPVALERDSLEVPARGARDERGTELCRPGSKGADGHPDGEPTAATRA